MKTNEGYEVLGYNELLARGIPAKILNKAKVSGGYQSASFRLVYVGYNNFRLSR